MYVVEDWCRVTECRLVGQGYDCMEGSVVGDGKDGISCLNTDRVIGRSGVYFGEE